MNVLRFTIALGFVVASCGVASAVSPPLQHHIRGTVANVSGSRITIATATGSVVVIVDAKTKYAGVVPGSVDDITPGTFIGTANVPAANGNRALEVVVFPASMKGTGEGDYPWDLSAPGNRASAMTNGTVAAPKYSAMTNATVSHVSGSALKTVTLQYAGGTKVVSIPPSAPIVLIAPASRALLVVGAHVFIAKTLGGTRIIIGERGATPPM